MISLRLVPMLLSDLARLWSLGFDLNQRQANVLSVEYSAMLQPLGFVLAAAAFGVNGQVLVKSPSRCPAGWLCQITKSNLDHKTPNRKQTVDPYIPERGLQRVFVSGGFEPLRCWAY